MKKTMYECAKCGKMFQAIEAGWVMKLDIKAREVLWRCPACRYLQKDVVRGLIEEPGYE